MKSKNVELIKNMKLIIEPMKAKIKRSASGKIKHDYLVPGGPYDEQWDWDGFFMGIALSVGDPRNSIYLKNWALNYIENAGADGKVAGCLTPNGYDPRLNHIKPFLSQGVFLASKFLKDFSWIKPHWATVKKIVLYRRRYLWNKKYNLGVWYDSMESGADNNVAVLDYPNSSVAGADLNTFMYLEFLSMKLIASALGDDDEVLFGELAESVRNGMLKHLWDGKEKIFYNLDTKNGSHIKRIGYSSFVPLWGKLLGEEEGKETIRRYLLSEDFMWAKYGIRTLAKNDPAYNNRNIIKPFSNWQGPIWIISNYIYMQGLINYGLQKEAILLAENITNLVLKDIESTGGMHENYDAETGESLAAPNFASWNILVENMLEDAINKRNPFSIVS